MDWFQRAPSEPFSIVMALWILDEFTRDNRPTRLVPESHLLTRPLPKTMQAPENHHPDEKVIVAQAGSVLVFNGHLWHSGTRNRANLPRRVLQIQFVARESIRTTDPLRNVPERLPPAAQHLLGFSPASVR
jgi:ectoine hydroxylase-related dioxygenase (phytanoyl-CoA dioxygenase family)